MIFFKKTVVLCAIVCKLTLAFSQSSGYPVKVYANGYRGYVAISGGTDFFLLQKDTTLLMQQDREGNYYINTGSTKGDCQSPQTSYIYMFFDKNGNIDSASLCPKTSVTLGKDHKSIYLKTALININPGYFNRGWHLSSRPKEGFIYGKYTVRLIKGQTYNINQEDAVLASNCRCEAPFRDDYYTAAFYFTVNEVGNIVLYGKDRIAARVYKNTLTFKTRCLTIDPDEIAGGKSLYFGNSKPNTPIITKRTKRYFIPGTVSTLHWKDSTGQIQAFHFLPL